VPSGYYLDLKADSKTTGLRIDPYIIAKWNEDPDVIPFVTWSDVVHIFLW